jgi:hypothetical protein
LRFVVTAVCSRQSIYTHESTATMIEELQSRIRTATGEQKVSLLNQLSLASYRTDPQQASTFSRQALEIARASNCQRGIADSLVQLANCDRELSDYTTATSRLR